MYARSMPAPAPCSARSHLARPLPCANRTVGERNLITPRGLLAQLMELTTCCSDCAPAHAPRSARSPLACPLPCVDRSIYHINHQLYVDTFVKSREQSDMYSSQSPSSPPVSPSPAFNPPWSLPACLSFCLSPKPIVRICVSNGIPTRCPITSIACRRRCSHGAPRGVRVVAGGVAKDDALWSGFD
jgi:hypothetical protein